MCNAVCQFPTAYSLPLNHTPCFSSLVLSWVSVPVNSPGWVNGQVAWVINVTKGLRLKPSLLAHVLTILLHSV